MEQALDLDEVGFEALTSSQQTSRVIDHGTGEPPPFEFSAMAVLVDAVVKGVWDWTPVDGDGAEPADAY